MQLRVQLRDASIPTSAAASCRRRRRADRRRHNVPVGSLGFRGRFGGWNSLETRDFEQNRLKAFMKVQF